MLYIQYYIISKIDYKLKTTVNAIFLQNNIDDDDDDGDDDDDINYDSYESDDGGDR
jgi:hypothetical protein